MINNLNSFLGTDMRTWCEFCLLNSYSIEGNHERALAHKSPTGFQVGGSKLPQAIKIEGLIIASQFTKDLGIKMMENLKFS